jgi:hypothetical protein
VAHGGNQVGDGPPTRVAGRRPRRRRPRPRAAGPSCGRCPRPRAARPHEPEPRTPRPCIQRTATTTCGAGRRCVLWTATILGDGPR